MRSLFCLACFLLVPKLAHCSPYDNKKFLPINNEVKIVNIFVKNHVRDDFKRIKEYFNRGNEYQGRRCIVRDDESIREGLYFVINFNKPLNKLPQDLSVNIYLMIGRSLNYEKYTFNLPNKRPSFVTDVYLGITSKQIDGSKINAWKVELVDSFSEEIITSFKNYMWPKIY